MAFKRYANAIVSDTNIRFSKWMDEMRHNHGGISEKNHVNRVAKTILKRVDPSQYLLSHSTIVASVDTYQPKNPRLGKTMERGIEILTRFPDYRLKNSCQRIINNNGDAWERALLLSSYKTFVGAPNYLEHVQIPELSKGFIVDAIARDLGDTVYVDILVATDKKHKVLIDDIQSGKLNAMSMGCISLFTICSRCGNVAVDDTQLCPHILYDGKGSKFIDEEGNEQVLCELIGHVQVPNSNTFIEASWVGMPAFSGAVSKGILNSFSPSVAGKVNNSSKIYELRREDILNLDLSNLKVASWNRLAQDEDEPADDPVDDSTDDSEDSSDFDFSDDSDDTSDDTEDVSDDTEDVSDDSDSLDDSGSEPDKIDELVDQASEVLMKGLVDRLVEKFEPTPEDVGTVTPSMSDANFNDNLVRSSDFKKSLTNKFKLNPRMITWASNVYDIVSRGRNSIASSKLTTNDLIVFSWIKDIVDNKSYPDNLYKLALEVGPTKNYPSEESFIARCSMVANRPLHKNEKHFLLWKGRIASLSNNI